jgi:hypothetical protein
VQIRPNPRHPRSNDTLFKTATPSTIPNGTRRKLMVNFYWSKKTQTRFTRKLIPLR